MYTSIIVYEVLCSSVVVFLSASMLQKKTTNSLSFINISHMIYLSVFCLLIHLLSQLQQPQFCTFWQVQLRKNRSNLSPPSCPPTASPPQTSKSKSAWMLKKHYIFQILTFFSPQMTLCFGATCKFKNLVCGNSQDYSSVLWESLNCFSVFLYVYSLLVALN